MPPAIRPSCLAITILLATVLPLAAVDHPAPPPPPPPAPPPIQTVPDIGEPVPGYTGDIRPDTPGIGPETRTSSGGAPMPTPPQIQVAPKGRSGP
jgi:hypothetical protein